VSIAADRIGMAREIDFVNRVAVLAVAGSTVDWAGTSNTSSKVRPRPTNLSVSESASNGSVVSSHGAAA
jgi:hypothetical protein